MTRPNRPLRSDIAWSNAEAIGVHGLDLCQDLIGRVDFGAMAYLSVMGRLPDANAGRMINAILITLVEHGIVPSTLAARLTHAGAPEALQASVAAGLLGLGSVFVGSTEGAARLLGDALRERTVAPDEMPALAREIVQQHRARKQFLPGLGHPIHKPVDPRTVRLFAIARETGFHGPHVALVEALAQAATEAYGRPLPVNATGAIGALCCEMGLPQQAARGLGVMARAVGLVGHVLEESRQPLAMELWHRTEEEATAHMVGRFGDEHG